MTGASGKLAFSFRHAKLPKLAIDRSLVKRETRLPKFNSAMYVSLRIIESLSSVFKRRFKKKKKPSPSTCYWTRSENSDLLSSQFISFAVCAIVAAAPRERREAIWSGHGFYGGHGAYGGLGTYGGHGGYGAHGAYGGVGYGGGHGVSLAGPLLGPTSVVGPHVGATAVSAPSIGPARLSGSMAGPVHVSGAVAGPAVVTPSIAGPAHVEGYGGPFDGGYGGGDYGAGK